MFKVLKLNEISPVIDSVFPASYDVSKEQDAPDAILLRSFAMHEYPLADSLLSVARCGAGTNNIPIDKCTEKGIVVFNTPGANANAVKELVLAGLLLGSRKIVDGIKWASSLKGNGDAVAKMVEKGKGQFVGPEILGKKLAVIGLGAIGAKIANAAVALGMDVLGYDPYLSIDAAWNLDRAVKKVTDFAELLKEADYVTLHIPLTSTNKYMFNTETFAKMKQGAVLLNFSRGELVSNDDVKAAVASGKISRYVTDFPVEELLDVENIVCIPHLGASTPEAEDNCAEMAAKQTVDYLENGNIRNSVNYPATEMPRSGKCRVAIHHRNVKDMISQITSLVSADGFNIENFVSKSRGDYAYCLLDLNAKAGDKLAQDLSKIEGVLRVRIL